MTLSKFIFIAKRLRRQVLGEILFALPSRRKQRENGLSVFLFHDISPTPSEFSSDFNLNLTPADFRLTLERLSDEYNFVTADQILNGSPLPKNAALISFDDGFSGTFEYGLPILECMNIPSLIFLNFAPLVGSVLISAQALYLAKYSKNFNEYFPDKDMASAHLWITPNLLKKFVAESDCPENADILNYQGDFVDWNTVKSWDNHPLVKFGNHLYNHWNAPSLTEEEFATQLTLNNYKLGELDSYLPIFAFPNGRFTEKLQRQLKGLNIERCFTTIPKVNDILNTFTLNRFCLDYSTLTKGELKFALSKN